ncbi:MAG: ATP-binding protein [Bacteroidota bacterium]
MPSLALPRRLESVSSAVEATEVAARRAGLSHTVQVRVSLAVAEAVSNAVEHGSSGDDSGNVHVAIEVERGQLIVEVCDEGSGVDAQAMEMAALPEDPFQTHGRGLYLIRVLTDQWHVDGSCLRMAFRERPE